MKIVARPKNKGFHLEKSIYGYRLRAARSVPFHAYHATNQYPCGSWRILLEHFHVIRVGIAAA